MRHGLQYGERGAIVKLISVIRAGINYHF